MVQLDCYKCDRCGKEYSLEHGQIPEHIVESSSGKQRTSDLCEDCISSFYFWLSRQYYKRFDKLAGELAEEEWE